MAVLSRLSRVYLRSPALTTVSGGPTPLISHFYSTASLGLSKSPTESRNNENNRGKWLTLPPFKSTVNGASLGKDIARERRSSAAEGGGSSSTSTTAIKWVMRCCPQLPKSLVQKLFRLRQVRRETYTGSSSDQGVQTPERRLKRVSAKDSMNLGDTIHLPISVQELPTRNAESECSCNEEELNFLHGLELYKDSAIIVINKPPGMPVQGGIGIKRSLDELAGVYLRHEFSEPPRLVHRLDRDSSGILVLGRTQLSATVLHSIFREKTFGASNSDLKSEKRFLQRKYWALVLGCPHRPQGLISVPLRKVVVDNGRSERITIAEDMQTTSTQHAITEYRVLDSSIHGLTWLELYPLTGRKHQLRVHCAEVLGTPIVGDYKYGWQAHRKWEQLFSFDPEEKLNEEMVLKAKSLPFGLDLESGSISNKQPNLHLHCKKMVLPDVSSALKHAQISSPGYDFGDVKSLKFSAPLPPHMQRSWDILCS